MPPARISFHRKALFKMKKPTYYLAIDFGASSGRHILAHLEDGEMKLEEIYRFENGVAEKNGHLCWDYEHLWNEVLNGLRRCRELDKIPSYMGIDTWGVDFVLLDGEDRLVGDTVAYRDSRTDGMEKVVYNKVSAEELFRRTGVPYQPFNTIYQLVALREKEPAILAAAKSETEKALGILAEIKVSEPAVFAMADKMVNEILDNKHPHFSPVNMADGWESAFWTWFVENEEKFLKNLEMEEYSSVFFAIQPKLNEIFPFVKRDLELVILLFFGLMTLAWRIYVTTPLLRISVCSLTRNELRSNAISAIPDS